MRQTIKKVLAHLSELSPLAAQTSFFLFLSLFPCLILIFSLIGSIPGAADAVFETFEGFIPEQARDFALSLAHEASERNPAPVSVVTVLLVWAAIKGLLTLGKALRNAYLVSDVSYSGLFSPLILFSLAMLAPVFMVGNVFLRSLILFLPVGVIICCVYALTSRGRFLRHIPGAALASFGWLVFSALFSLFSGMGEGYSLLYGSLGAVALVMVWLNSCVMILLVGARLNSVLSGAN